MSISTGPTSEDLRVIAEEVWASYLDPEGIRPLLLDYSPDEKLDGSDGEVSAAVSVTGAWRGHVVVACTSAASKHAAAALLGIGLDDVGGDDVADALGELANVIGGNVKSLLPEPSALSLPHVVIAGPSSGSRWPAVTELCRLSATWYDEPIVVSVLESTSREGASAA